jgi:hypothetical protein
VRPATPGGRFPLFSSLFTLQSYKKYLKPPNVFSTFFAKISIISARFRPMLFLRISRGESLWLEYHLSMLLS